MIASESLLAGYWDTPEDYEAWEYLSDEALTGFEDAINDEPRQEVVEMIERSSRDNAAIWRELAKE